GTKMEDVIFGGTDDRKPMGFAEVSVTFDNSDKLRRIDSPYDEITVTRRYYRSGESEYSINKKPCRLRDINELFMNTGVGREGYSIIGQGRIAEILSQKSEDRRNIFEDAAGIAKFRHKKTEAERKLAEAENNMKILYVQVSELESRVGPLEAEAEKARKYLELYEEKKQADISLWLFDTQKLREDLQKAGEDYRLAKNEYDIVAEAVESLKKQEEHLYELNYKNKLESETLLSRINECNDKIHQLENEYTVSRTESSHRKDLIEQCVERSREIDLSIEKMHEEIGAHNAKILELKKELEHLDDERLDVLAAQQQKMEEAAQILRTLDKTLEQYNELNRRAIDLRVRIDVIKKSQSSESGRGTDLLSEIEKYEKEGEELAKEVERCEGNASAFKSKISDSEEIILSKNQEKEKAELDLQAATDSLGALKVEHNTLIQRADALRRMEEHFEGYNESTRYVMREYTAGRIRGGVIHGPISQLITVKPEYITAIETALGVSIQNIVVDDETTAKAAIAALKEARAGRATFYPISAIRSGGETDEIRRAASFAGYVGRGDALVGVDAKYREIIEWLLIRTVVFDNLDHASEAARALRYKVRIVTLDGQIINAGGSYTGGSTKRDSGILTRSAEIDKIEAAAKEKAKQISSAEEKVEKIKGDILHAQEEIKDAEQQKELLLTMSRAQFSAIDSANAKLEANRELTQKLRLDLEALEDEKTRSGEELLTLTEELSDLEVKLADINHAREADEIMRNGILDEVEVLKDRNNEKLLRVTEVRKDIEATEQLILGVEERIGALHEDKNNQVHRIKEHEEKIKSLEAVLQANRENLRAFREDFERFTKERGNIESGNDELSRRIASVRQSISEKESHKENSFKAFTTSESKLQRMEADRDRMDAKLTEEYDIYYEDAVKLNYPAVTAENRAAVAAIQLSCKRKISALGPNVRVAAIEEFKEVNERYRTLNTQYSDMTKSRDELLRVIGELEVEMRESFIATFVEINKNFGVVFSELFGGGTAELSLTDPEEILTSGIEIKAAPPGKIIKNLSLLSGGERSFVAIALIFAILKVNPTPFCILDEVEAALDEVNVYRFGEYIQRLCEDTQFVLITHRRGTMEVANRLYGVTMPDRGISKVIGLAVDEIESKKKELDLDGIL
ncbi:MAG: chromosome segregation protein SMC, partial [Clostridia bacterium]|nr:chromosome segregation protein SMC [Clostridia bacterium]